jgi:hypothetical protein
VTTAVRDRAPSAPVADERTERRPVLLLSLDILFDEQAIEDAVGFALEANVELLVCLANTLPTANANAAARRHMGNPVVREQMARIVHDAREAGADARSLVYNSPRPLYALFEVVRSRGIGLVVFGPNRRSYGRLRFRWHLRRIRRGADCLVWPLEA